MSLINEALKRAQQTQQENPPPTPPLEFRPVEPDQRAPRRTALLVVGLTVVIIALLGLSGLLIRVMQASKQTPLTVAARTNDPVAVEPAPEATLTPEITEIADSVPAEAPIEADVTNAEAIVPAPAEIEAAPQPPPLKLQGIFFNPQNPSAIVSGKSVYLGDRVNNFQVIAISPVAVILASATETNVLSLSE